jgi:16S rRNA (guanine527-N7)-methyltransferase
MSLSKSVQEKLEKYCSNMIKWNKAYNLLSNSQTESEIWDRHILDSTQIFEFIPKTAEVIVDLGSGAGLPVVPCAIMAEGNAQKFIAIESINKKTTFLEDTARILGLKNFEVRNKRIEDVNDIKADVITARAFAKIDEIFAITKSLAKPSAKFILLKGKNIDDEIATANKSFSFDFQKISSKTGDGFIFIAENVKQI